MNSYFNYKTNKKTLKVGKILTLGQENKNFPCKY